MVLRLKIQHLKGVFKSHFKYFAWWEEDWYIPMLNTQLPTYALRSVIQSFFVMGLQNLFVILVFVGTALACKCEILLNHFYNN